MFKQSSFIQSKLLSALLHTAVPLWKLSLLLKYLFLCYFGNKTLFESQIEWLNHFQEYMTKNTSSTYIVIQCYFGRKVDIYIQQLHIHKYIANIPPTFFLCYLNKFQIRKSKSIIELPSQFFSNSIYVFNNYWQGKILRKEPRTVQPFSSSVNSTSIY